VDDGSDEQQQQRLKQAVAEYAQFDVSYHAGNMGKGAAMMTGARRARELGFTHMLQIDADGQHDVADVPKFLEMARRHPTAIISGAPQFEESAPKARVYGRKVTDFWVILETWSTTIKDSLCGFRVYPLAEFELVCQRFAIGKRMEFDTDVMVRSAWLDIPIKFIDTKVVYRPGNNSHFHYLRDNLRLIWLHTRLMVGMLCRAPLWILRKPFRERV
jgi:glycosyltransferase involved in cell wall biosynthesis